VAGVSVVREQGDAVHAILESINLPVISVPIVRNGQALIDGGIVNNIPADVLVSMGCNFVIAVSVTAKMEKKFGNITDEVPSPSRRPNIVQTILRCLLVQNHSLNAFGVAPADVMIAPDVRGFDLTEFVRAKKWPQSARRWLLRRYRKSGVFSRGSIPAFSLLPMTRLTRQIGLRFDEQSLHFAHTPLGQGTDAEQAA
jgi:predicted acylesterase/phospholipase RssA